MKCIFLNIETLITSLKSTLDTLYTTGIKRSQYFHLGNQFSKANLQQGIGNNAQLLALLRRKRDAQFIDVWSAVGTQQVGFNGSSFLKENL